MSITVYANNVTKKQPNFWNHFHFHPTDAIEDDWGQAILDQCAIDRIGHTVRMYTMFEDIVTQDSEGNLHYDYTLNDIRMDYMLSKGFNLLVCYNFIPPFLASDSGVQSNVTKNKTRYKGKMITTSPPKDYGIWEEICYQYTKHILERYGIDTVKNWYLHCYNEPDIKPFWMTDLPNTDDIVPLRLAEYKKLYASFEKGVNRASMEVKIGGPTLANRIPFLDEFLAWTKETGKKLDFVCFHNYGTSPKGLNSGENPLRVSNNIQKIADRIAVIRKYYPEDTEILIDEWGASSAGFHNMEECPQLMFRETELFSAYFGRMVTTMIDEDLTPAKLFICLSGQHEMTQDFSGFRNFLTLNFIKKPIYNAYALMRHLGTQLLAKETTVEDLCVLATREDDHIAILLTYTPNDYAHVLPQIQETLTIHGVNGSKKVTVHRIDENHTNPYGLYLREGMTKDLTQEQIELLRREGTLVPTESFTVTPAEDGTVKLDVSLTHNAMVLVELDA